MSIDEPANAILVAAWVDDLLQTLQFCGTAQPSESEDESFIVPHIVVDRSEPV